MNYPELNYILLSNIINWFVYGFYEIISIEDSVEVLKILSNNLNKLND